MKLDREQFSELMGRYCSLLNDYAGITSRGPVVLMPSHLTGASGILVTSDGSDYALPSNPEVALIEVWRDGVWLHEGPWVAVIEKVLTDLEAEVQAAQDARDAAEATRKAAETKRVDDARVAWEAKARKSVTPNIPNEGDRP